MKDPLLRRFNATIDHWIASLDRYTPDMLRQEPSPGAWSLGQVYTHLIDDTGFFVEQMKTALATNEHAGAEMHPDATRMFAHNSFPAVDIAGPATGKHIPQPEYPRQALTAIRDEVNRLDFARASGKTKHPGLGFFSAQEWLQFAEMHMRHHIRQQKKIEVAIAGGYTRP